MVLFSLNNCHLSLTVTRRTINTLMALSDVLDELKGVIIHWFKNIFYKGIHNVNNSKHYQSKDTNPLRNSVLPQNDYWFYLYYVYSWARDNNHSKRKTTSKLLSFILNGLCCPIQNIFWRNERHLWKKKSTNLMVFWE